MNEELVIKLLNNQCSERDLEEIKLLLKNGNFQNELGELLYQRWDDLESGELNEEHKELLDKIHQKIEWPGEAKKKKAKTRRLDYTYVAQIAASVLILISVLAGVFYMTKDSGNNKPVVEAKEMMMKSTDFGEKRTFMLPDNSKVILNSGSSLQYSVSLDTDHIREVMLSGEAYFEVDHSDDKPFQVITDLGKTTVLGTKFGVSNRDESLTVTLAEGSVRVGNVNEDQSVVIAPGQMAQLGKTSNQIDVRQVHVSTALAWKEGILYFDKEPFKDIVLKLEKWYAVDIKVDDAINREITLSGEFNNESLYNILSGLAFSLDLQFNINNKSVEINKI